MDDVRTGHGGLRRQEHRRPKGSGTIEERPNGLFRAKIWVAGERRQATFPKRSAANSWLEQQLAERVARDDGTISTRGFRPTLKLKDLKDDFLKDLEQSGRTKQTRRGYRSHVAKVVELWGETKAAHFDGPFLERIVAKMHQLKWSASTIRNRLAALSGMLKLGQRKGYTPARPIIVRRPRVTLASRPDAYDAAEVAALLKVARKQKDPRFACAILLGCDAGLRRGEIVRFQAGDFDQASMTITVPVRDQDDRPKSGKARMVPITRELAVAIEKCGAKPDERVVGKPVWNTADQLPVWLEEIWAAAGVEGGVRLHRLRHYWASTLANEGKATPWELMEWGGWASLDMVRRYYHAPLRVNRAPVKALERARLVPDKSQDREGASVAPRKSQKIHAV